MPARQPLRRKPRRPARQAPRLYSTLPADARVEGVAAALPDRSHPMSPRSAAAERAVALARQEVIYLRRDLRNVVAIAGLMLIAVIALTFILR